MTSPSSTGEDSSSTSTMAAANHADAASTATAPFPIVAAIFSALIIAGSVAAAHFVNFGEDTGFAITGFSFLTFLLYVGVMMTFMMSEEPRFEGVQLGIISFGEASSRFGRSFLVFYLPCTGFGAFFRTIFSSYVLGPLWTLMVGTLLFCVNLALHRWLTANGAT